MILAKIAAVILGIALVLVISTKLLWLVFLLFAYRTISDFLPYEFFVKLGVDNHLFYFILILIITLALYALLLRFTMDISWVRYIVIVLLAIYCLFNYSLSELLFFQDYFEDIDLWNIDWYKAQMSEFYSSPTALPDMILAFLNDVIQIMKAFFTGYINK